MPCHRARARQLLNNGKAKVYRHHPFTIILIERKGGQRQPLDLKFDPGSKVTGIGLCGRFQKGDALLWASELKHRGEKIRKSLEKRRALRRGRRWRKTRYRQPRFNNRRRKKGWLAPSLKSRVDNVYTWAKKLCVLAPVTRIEVEICKFDIQKMQNPEISGIEYQQGELCGYETREYLLEKWQRKCAYCGRENVALQVEHIVAKANGGTNRISNLTLSCANCNCKKGTTDIREFLSKDPKGLEKILVQAKTPLKDAAAVNSCRFAIGQSLKQLGLPIGFASGGRTKYNRTRQEYSKDHWIDAACVGPRGANIFIADQFSPATIEANGRGTRQVCRVNKYGFVRTSAKRRKRIQGFQTGDLVRANVTKGKKEGKYQGRVAVRASGNFNITTDSGVVQGINYRFCRKIQHCDGYSYV